MADKNMANFVNGNFKSGELHLSTLSAINKNVTVLNGEVLTGWEAAIHGNRTAGTEDC